MANIDDIIRLHSNDNIGVSRRNISVDETITINGTPVRVAEDIPVGHKVALGSIANGEKILKYGAPIGSSTAKIDIGRHVHLHNMKSDYIASYTRQGISE
ncbi:MAG: UxaA family hydrolase [Porticoccaceae bacterium]|nr:UxaA family hydrolase [Porticoccaceae bacterium]